MLRIVITHEVDTLEQASSVVDNAIIETSLVSLTMVNINKNNGGNDGSFT